VLAPGCVTLEPPDRGAAALRGLRAPALREYTPSPDQQLSSGASTSGCAAPGRTPEPTLGVRLPREAVALAVDRQDVFGALGIALELLPEPEDVSVDRPSRGEALVTPHLVE
jgi:hypothetical protein